MKARRYYDEYKTRDNILYVEDMEDIFPELKESEDEKMRKSIIYALRNGGFYDSDKTDEAIAWLEKQGNGKDIHLLELKAKAYDDAKERMSYAYNQNRVPIGFMNEIFPNIKLYEKQGEHKSIWHNEDEEPQRGSLILLIMQSGTPVVAKIIEPNHTFNHGERWAYIEDLYKLVE